MARWLMCVATVVALYLYDRFEVNPKWLVYALTLIAVLLLAALVDAYGASREDND
jgi:hypothetical protein